MLKGSNLISANGLVVVVLVLLVVSITGWLTTVELRAEEPRRGVVAMETYTTGDYLHPALIGESYYNKPPFYNWVLSASYAITGTFNEVAVRLPGILSFLLTGWFTFLFARKYLGKETAAWAAFGYLTCFHLIFYATVNAGEIDLFYGLVTMIEAFVIFHFFERQQWWRLFLISSLLAAVGFLTKGFPSVLFQAVTLIVWFAVHRRFWKLFSLPSIAGAGLFVLIVAGYFYAYSMEHDVLGYLSKLFDESSEKSLLQTSFTDSLFSFVRFPGMVFIHLLPLGGALLLLISKPYRVHLNANRLTKFAWIFIVANILVYWITPKFIARYLYVFLPFFMMMSAHLLTHWLAETKRRETFFKVAAVVVLIGGLAQGVVVFLPAFSHHIYIVAGIIIALLLMFTAWRVYLRRSHLSAALWLAGAVFLGRISFNIGVLPQTQQKINKGNNYRGITEQLLEQTGGKEITLLGKYAYSYPKMKLAGYTFHADTVVMAPHIPFQLPYYYRLYTGKTMTFTPQAKPGEYYIGFTYMLKDMEGFQVIDSFRTGIRGLPMQLVKGN